MTIPDAVTRPLINRSRPHRWHAPGRSWTRRCLVRRTATWTGLAFATVGAGLAPGSRVRAQGTPAATPNPTDLVLKGISYDVGIDWAPGESSRPTWELDYVRHDIAAIRHGLNCTAISLFGTDPSRVMESAGIALAEGLEVWLQPRLVNGDQAATLDQLAAFARGAEELRRTHPKVVLNTGCELSVFMSGIVPGDSFEARIATLGEQWTEIPAFSEALNGFLEEATAAVRDHFDGAITYGAGTWEAVDWSAFDFIGLNHYRSPFFADTYVSDLQHAVGQGKPVVITVFGCGTFEGAAEMGGAGWGIVDWTTSPPSLNGDYVRSEQEQADELLALLDLFATEGVHGAFVFTFIEPTNPYSPDPRFDLDMASFSVVKTFPADSGQSYDEAGYWEPKESFHALAQRHEVE